MSDTDASAPAPEASGKKKKGKLKKLLVPVLGVLILAGGGVGAGLYAASSGLVGGAHPAGAGADPNAPHLVPKSEQKRGGEGAGDGGHGGSGEGEEASGGSHGGAPTPAGSGGEKYASNYYQMEKEFTSNLSDSAHFIQVGIAISTPYDDKVIEHLKTNDIAVRSAILMTLGDTTEEQVFTSDGKRLLQRRLVGAINATLKEKEGFGGVGNVYFTNFVVQ